MPSKWLVYPHFSLRLLVQVSSTYSAVSMMVRYGTQRERVNTGQEVINPYLPYYPSVPLFHYDVTLLFQEE